MKNYKLSINIDLKGSKYFENYLFTDPLNMDILTMKEDKIIICYYNFSRWSNCQILRVGLYIDTYKYLNDILNKNVIPLISQKIYFRLCKDPDFESDYITTENITSSLMEGLRFYNYEQLKMYSQDLLNPQKILGINNFTTIDNIIFTK